MHLKKCSALRISASLSPCLLSVLDARASSYLNLSIIPASVVASRPQFHGIIGSHVVGVETFLSTSMTSYAEAARSVRMFPMILLNISLISWYLVGFSNNHSKMLPPPVPHVQLGTCGCRVSLDLEILLSKHMQRSR